jgi:hypothetical protein
LNNDICSRLDRIKVIINVILFASLDPATTRWSNANVVLKPLSENTIGVQRHSVVPRHDILNGNFSSTWDALPVLMGIWDGRIVLDIESRS